MFDSNAMLELAHLSRDRYQRAGGGGGTKVYNTAKAYDEARGYRDMSKFRRAAYEAAILWKLKADDIVRDFKWAVRADREDVLSLGLPSIPYGAVYHVISSTF